MSIHFDRKSGRWRYQFDLYIAGERKRASRLLPKGWTRAAADKYNLKETARLYGIASGVTEQQHLIDDAVLAYLTHHAPRLESFKNIQRELWAFSGTYAGRVLSELPEVAREYASAQAGILAPATVRNRLAYLRAACRYAWKHHEMGEADPTARMAIPKVNNARHFYWSRAQFIAICRKMPPGAKRAAVRIAFYSGMRAGEVVKAKVSPARDLFDLGRTKNGLPRLVPVHPRLAHILRNPDLWPPKYTKWTISKAFKKAARLAGFPEAVLHDMRHSTASEMARGGADLYTIGGVLGHKSTVTTQRYTHLVTGHLKSAVGLVGRNPPTSGKPKAAANG